MMAIRRVNLKPIGEAIEKAQADLKELAKHAPPEKSFGIKAKVEALDIVHVQVQVLCRSNKIPPYGFCKILQKNSKVRPPYGVSIEDDC
jgi:hypothetical protein